MTKIIYVNKSKWTNILFLSSFQTKKKVSNQNRHFDYKSSSSINWREWFNFDKKNKT